MPSLKSNMKSCKLKKKYQLFSTVMLKAPKDKLLVNLLLLMITILIMSLKSENQKDQSKFSDLSIQLLPTNKLMLNLKLGSEPTRDQSSSHSIKEPSDKCSVKPSQESVCSTRTVQTFCSMHSLKPLNKSNNQESNLFSLTLNKTVNTLVHSPTTLKPTHPSTQLF